MASLAQNEGIAVDSDGNVFFTELATRAIVRFTPGPGLSSFRLDGNRASGLAFDSQGRLVICEISTAARQPRVTRTDMVTGQTEVLVETYDGQPLNGPNDVTVDGRDRIYFTDPGDTVPAGVYRIDLDGRLSRILTAPDIEWPNGIVTSPDDRTLFLSESSGAEGGTRLIRAYDLAEDGSISSMRVVFRFRGRHGPDGMAIDVEGNLYVAAGSNARWRQGDRLDPHPGILVLSPRGELLQTYPVYEDYITNCAFGGPDMRTLYITAGKSLYSVRTEIAGTRR